MNIRRMFIILSILIVFSTINNLQAQSRRRYEYRRISDFSIKTFPKNIKVGRLVLEGTYNPSRLKGLKIYQESEAGLAKKVKVFYHKNHYKAIFNFQKRGRYTIEIGKVYKTKGWQMGLLTKISVGGSNKNIATLPFKKVTRVKDAFSYTKVFFKRLNELRKRYNLPAYIWDNKLAKIALSHSKVCVQLNYIAHNTPTDKTPRDRAKTVGYNSVGENMAGGRYPEGALNSLFSSIAHRNSILSANYTKVGIGVVSRGISYIVTVNFLNEASQYRFEKQYQKAISVLFKQLDVVKGTIWNTHAETKQRILKGIGYSFYKLKKYDKAMGYFEEAYKIDSSNKTLVKLLAYTYRRTDRYFKAIKLLKKINKSDSFDKKIDDTIKLTYYLWARFYDKKKDYENANKIYHKTLALYPRYFQAIKMYGYNFYKQKKYQKAIQVYSRAIKLKASNQKEEKEIKNFHLRIAYCYYKLKNYKQATNKYEKNIKLYPREVKNYRYLSSCYSKEKNYLKAVAVSKKALKLFPDDEKVKKDLNRALKSYAYSFYKAKNYEKAIVAFKNYLRYYPKQYIAHRSLGWCYFKKKNYTAAVKYFKRALALKSDDKSSQNGLKSSLKKLDK